MVRDETIRPAGLASHSRSYARQRRQEAAARQQSHGVQKRHPYRPRPPNIEVISREQDAIAEFQVESEGRADMGRRRRTEACAPDMVDDRMMRVAYAKARLSGAHSPIEVLKIEEIFFVQRR